MGSVKLSRVYAYMKAKQAKVGDLIMCAGCFRRFTKTNYNQKFCRRKGGTVCKDKFHNKIKR